MWDEAIAILLCFVARYFVLEFSVLNPRYFAGDWMMWVSQDTLEYFHAVRFDDTVNAVYVVFRLCPLSLC